MSGWRRLGSEAALNIPTLIAYKQAPHFPVSFHVSNIQCSAPPGPLACVCVGGLLGGYLEKPREVRIYTIKLLKVCGSRKLLQLSD